MTNDCPVLAGPNDEIEIVKDGYTGRECKLSAEACANMRLMAAAPELLSALLALMSRFEATGEAWMREPTMIQAHTVISKAGVEL